MVVASGQGWKGAQGEGECLLLDSRLGILLIIVGSGVACSEIIVHYQFADIEL